MQVTHSFLVICLVRVNVLFRTLTSVPGEMVGQLLKLTLWRDTSISIFITHTHSPHRSHVRLEFLREPGKDVRGSVRTIEAEPRQVGQARHDRVEQVGILADAFDVLLGRLADLVILRPHRERRARLSRQKLGNGVPSLREVQIERGKVVPKGEQGRSEVGALEKIVRTLQGEGLELLLRLKSRRRERVWSVGIV